MFNPHYTFAINHVQSTILYPYHFILNPKYFSPSSRDWFWKGKFWRARLVSCYVHSDKGIVDLTWLISIPVAELNNLSTSVRVIMSWMPPSRKMRMSSTKSRCVSMHWSINLRPLRHPSRFFDAIFLLRPSMTNRNNSGDRGHPCLSPHSARKERGADPLIKIAKDIEVIQHNPSDKVWWKPQMSG